MPSLNEHLDYLDAKLLDKRDWFRVWEPERQGAQGETAEFARCFMSIAIYATRALLARPRARNFVNARAWLQTCWTSTMDAESREELSAWLDASYASFCLFVLLSHPGAGIRFGNARARRVAQVAARLLHADHLERIETELNRFVISRLHVKADDRIRDVWARIVRLKVPDVATRAFEAEADPVTNRAAPGIETSLELAAPETLAARAYPVWFGTNRKPINASDLSLGFGNERDSTNAVHHGVCTVDIPRLHRFGSIGTPFWERLLRFQLEDDHLRITGIRTFADEAGFGAALRLALSEAGVGQRCILLYLHGYNVSFEDAALRAAQLGCDLKVPGLTAFFSWPSKAETIEYFADIARVEASEAQIANFIECLVNRTGAEVVHVLAHSMGNRGFARAVARIQSAASSAGVRFGQIILAAPDVDIDLFRELAAVYPTLSQRTTMYVSAKDRALALSSWLQDSDRAGFTPPVTIVSGIDTVEATKIDVSTLGHCYYAEAAPVLYDIGDLLQDDKPPARRLRLHARTEGSDDYWLIAI